MPAYGTDRQTGCVSDGPDADIVIASQTMTKAIVWSHQRMLGSLQRSIHLQMTRPLTGEDRPSIHLNHWLLNGHMGTGFQRETSPRLFVTPLLSMVSPFMRLVGLIAELVTPL